MLFLDFFMSWNIPRLFFQFLWREVDTQSSERMVWGPAISEKYYGQIIKLYQSLISTWYQTGKFRVSKPRRNISLKRYILNFFVSYSYNFANTDIKNDSYIIYVSSFN